MHTSIEFVGQSSWASELRASIAQAAGFRSSVLVTGASGTGKELIARAIHDQSPRAEAPFVAVDCTAIPASLFASQLFGHVQGAFSGAACDTLGCFRAAEGGTIFLDEIGELSLDLQAQLLRVIQQRTVTPVGSHDDVPVDVRIVAATNRDLAAEVRAGRFREDLYYRLNVVRLCTAPLAERRQDIVLLANHFLAKLAIENGLSTKRLSAAAERLLESLDWPGNVRELQNVLERVVVFTPQQAIEPDDIRKLLESESTTTTPIEPAIEHGSTEAPAEPVGLDRASYQLKQGSLPTLAEGERRLIEAALEETFYNQSAAARLLDVDRKLLARKIRKYGIALPTSRDAPTRKPK